MSGIALVTGASAGIGRATADLLTARGWTVVGASRRGLSGSGWAGLAMDVDDDQSVADGVAAILDSHQRVDAVVACAGYGLAGPSESTPLTDAHAQLETNFWGVVRVVVALLPTMREQRRGRIVLMSSIGGEVGIPFQSFYSASKFALEGWGESLAYEVAPFVIAVTLVQPGNVSTDFTASRRQIELADEDDPYGQTATAAIEKMAAAERTGVAPEKVAVTVTKVLDARRPPRRVSVGHTNERIGLLAKRLLPARLFESAAKRSLGV